MAKTCTKCGTRGSAPKDFREDRSVCRKCCSKARHPERHLDEQRFNKQKWANTERFLAEIQQATLPKEDYFVVTDPEPEIIVTEVEKLTPVEEHRLKVKNAELLRQVKSLTE